MSGANDAVKPGLPQHIPLEEFEKNIRYMVEQLTSSDSKYATAHEKGFNVVLVTPPPILLSMTGNDERIPERTKQYVDVVAKLADEFKSKQKEHDNWRIGLVNMYDAIIAAAGGDGEEMRPYLADGLHLTTQGYGVFWDEYTKLVRGEFKGRGLDWDDWSDLPPRMPNWQDVDPKHPEHLPDQMKLPPIRESDAFDKEARELDKEQPPQETKTGKGCTYL
ncbi:hypothetical protein A1Q1_06162 [Trichosporon asahii var. asahii CBS 2479]|uniref:SGNH hydrolase-type esterase domain-containing protein n=1 Tax=Trichosporon asahii var. asahii (strain ATCC 90039 / CBS 2479 / JCM 2466 / KCTC 7840 / NBRC 103889/ NCYC 2677 / UAMH 7654) TaxID=1186058 RepID=J6EM58_TRIAS|nr:hypothetical protein A1Q1_06162 [Trichosporon asahii var. asahii CBS 2479]EJT45399.1 hypothetical protein A1Q1_06162 [Trichosporon asahii var. asahii CBS 2479]